MDNGVMDSMAPDSDRAPRLFRSLLGAIRVGLWIALVASTVGASGCVTPSQHKTQELMMISRQFNSDIRWGRYEEAAASLPPAEAARFMARVELVEKELIMADAEVAAIKMGPDGNSATAVVRIQWYTHRDNVIRDTVLKQYWIYGATWTVKSQERTRGARFPLVAERSEKNASKTPPAAKTGAPNPEESASEESAP